MKWSSVEPLVGTRAISRVIAITSEQVNPPQKPTNVDTARQLTLTAAPSY
jgi:hypothetical protein